MGVNWLREHRSVSGRNHPDCPTPRCSRSAEPCTLPPRSPSFVLHRPARCVVRHPPRSPTSPGDSRNRRCNAGAALACASAHPARTLSATATSSAPHRSSRGGASVPVRYCATEDTSSCAGSTRALTPIQATLAPFRSKLRYPSPIKGEGRNKKTTFLQTTACGLCCPMKLSPLHLTDRRRRRLLDGQGRPPLHRLFWDHFCLTFGPRLRAALINARPCANGSATIN
jgi:hypothetical protein